MAVNTQKLLSSAKGSPLAKIRSSKIIPTVSIKKKTIDTQKLIGPVKQDDPKSIQKTLMNIDSSLKLLLKEEQTQQSKKRKEKEKADFEKEEKKLEAPKEAKRFNLPKLSLPGASFLDRIKRFLFFTALGWLFTKFQDQLPKLEGILKTITQVYGVAENIFKFLLESFVNVIDRGYKAYDKVRDLAKSIGGEKAQKDFDNLSSKLNEYINYALIGGIALTGAINSFAKEVKGRKGKDGGTTAGVGAGSKTPSRTPTGYRLDRGRFAPKGFENIATPGQTRVTQYGPLKKNIFQRAGQASGIGARKATQAVIGKQATKQLLRLAKGPLSRLPIVGGLIEFGLSYALGEPVGKAAFRGVGTLLLGAVGSLILPGWGTFIGGFLGAELAGKLYEVLFENKQPKGKVQAKQGGGPVTRGGKNQSGPSRSITITRRKPPKIKPKQSQPGKDVGGKKKIRELYPDPSVRTDIEGDQKGAWWNLLPPLAKDATPEQIQQRNDKIKALPNSYKALTGVAKKLKDIPFGIGALMGGAVDIALGEKLPKNAIQSLSNGISYLISSIANQQASASISSIEKEISKMQTGGAVPKLKDFTKRDDLELGKDINKVLSGLIQQKVDEAIREVQKQLMPGKYGEKVTPSGERGPSAPPTRGPGGGAGGGPSPTGENGRLSESILKSVGQGGCRGGCRLWKPAADAYLKMKADAAKDKVYFQLESAYRSYEHQAELYDAYKRGTGNLAAPPGTSDHGLGKAIDLYPTAAQNWVRAKGRQYGWYWPPETGEPWHFVYSGGGRLEPQKQQTQLPKQQPQIPDVQNYGVKEGEQKRVRYNNQNYVIARDKDKWRVYKVNPTTGLLEEVDRTDRSFVKVLDEYRKTQSPTSPAPQTPIVGGQSLNGIYKQAADLIAGYESSSSGGYNAMNRGGGGDSPEGPKKYFGKNLTDMTIGEIMALQSRGRKTLNAAGRYQFVGNTLPSAMRNAGLKSGDKFSSTNQDKMFLNTLQVSGHRPWTGSWGLGKYTKEQLKLLDEAVTKIRKEGPQGPQRPGYGGNMQGGGYIPKQSPRKDTQRLSSYPSYSAEGRMMIAIQPMIIEKVVTVPSGRRGGGGAVVFPIAGVNNSNMQSLSRG
jgi:hypothetical protein